MINEYLIAALMFLSAPTAALLGWFLFCFLPFREADRKEAARAEGRR